MIIREEFIKKKRERFTKKNKNWIAAFCGPTGSGKTYSALELVREINPNFDIEHHIVFKVDQFMDLLDSKTLKRGDIIIFEEAGVGMSSKEWYAQSNKLFSYVLQTFRHLGIGVIFTMPSLSFLDKSARILLHTYFETHKIDFKKKVCIVKIFNTQYNIRQDKIYYKHPKFTEDDGNIVTLDSIGLKLPPPDILEEYEKMKTNYTSTLNTDIRNSIKQEAADKKPKKGCHACGSAQIIYYKKEHNWTCKKCGHVHLSNPFS